jgi:Spy/CpxP family protein refolding chaperone
MTPEQQITRLEETVGKLTDDQKTKITAIYAKQGEKMRALRDDQSLSSEDRRAKRDEMMKATRNEMRALLTPEQQPKFDAAAETLFRGGRGGPRGEGEPRREGAPRSESGTAPKTE